MPSLVARLAADRRRTCLDHHSASQCTPLYDIEARDWYTPWAERDRRRPRAAAACAGRATWPATVSAEAAGETGLPAGIPVITGTIDAWSEAVSVGAYGAGDLMLMYGSTMFLIATVDRAADHPDAVGHGRRLPGTR